MTGLSAAQQWQRPDPASEFKVDSESIAFTWGRFDVPGTASFWVDQALRRDSYRRRVQREVDSADLRAQTVFCLLGGHGVTAEMAGATYVELCRRVDFDTLPTADVIEAALRTPVGLNGRMVRYRFWRQRAQRIAGALQILDQCVPPDDSRALRDWLTAVPGIGLKTASWIVRNTTGSDEVAIIDIWLVRALTRAGVFPEVWTVPRDYHRYERTFLAYADAGGVSASVLDWCIWDLGRVLLPLLPPLPDYRCREE